MQDRFIEKQTEVLTFRAGAGLLSKKVEYQVVTSKNSLETSLKRAKSEKFPGFDGEIKANFTRRNLDRLHFELKTQRFMPSPIKKIYLSSSDGSKRLLSMASQKDKIVQIALLEQLEPILEKYFLDCSYGQRPRRNSHLVLKTIKRRWQNVCWLIHIGIFEPSCISHHAIILNELKTFCDQSTTELIAKFLKVGYIDIIYLADFQRRIMMGVPPSSIISPIFANLFLHSLDKFVSSYLLLKWNYGDSRVRLKIYKNPEFTRSKMENHLEVPIGGTSDCINSTKVIEIVDGDVLNKTSNIDKGFCDENFRRLYYVRYLDEVLLGFYGTKCEANEITREIKNFLEKYLKLELCESQSRIHLAYDESITFLGFLIKYSSTDGIQKVLTVNEENRAEPLTGARVNLPQLRIPVKMLLQKVVTKEYAKFTRNSSVRAISCRRLVRFEDVEIVEHFSSIIRGLVQYYSPANSFSDLWQVISVYRKSCALTLADKHQLKSATVVYKRHGPFLKVRCNKDPAKIVLLEYPESLKTTNNFKVGMSKIGPYLLESVLI